MSDSSADRDPLEALAEEFLDRFRKGERPALSEYTRRRPELADDIRELFPALVLLEDVRPASVAPMDRVPRSGSPAARPERLGDYRILREIGRGGMGVVYEAEQESLGRHVALKVLPVHALLQPQQLERFQREARSAARLHHTNIVPVFGVGEQDGLHYYVMQFIQGQGLDQVLAVLQQLRGGPGASPSAAPATGVASAAAVANALLTGVFALPAAEVAPAPSSLSSSSSVHLPGQPSSSTLSDSGRPYWHSVARIGIQAADALAYAHAQGTLHRDIKPANLLLDTQGIVWVTDFGLAKAAGSEDLTHTGDVVGTLRYMAPERFRGKADARSDVYGLGLTLYELLTLQPAFDAAERDQLLLQVAHREPLRPRKRNPAVPRDLETIVLKAVARDPQHRYQNAAELAADLTRFTEDRPIRARPVSETERLWRWCRRNPSLAALASAFVVALVLGIAGTSWKWLDAEAERDKAGEAERLTAVERDRAMAARNQARQVLAGTLLDRGLALAEQGELGEGLVWMQEALHAAAPQSPELARAIRTNLAAWLAQTHQLQQFATRPTSLSWCAFTPDSRHLFTGGEAGVELWHDSEPAGRAIAGGAGAALALSPDGRRLLTGHRLPGSAFSLLERWDVATGQRLGAPLRHPGILHTATFAADGASFFTGDAEGTVRRWDSQTGAPVGTNFRHPGRYVSGLAVSPDGTRLAVATGVPGSFQEGQPAEAQLWDLPSGQPSAGPLTHHGLVRSVAFAPDGQSLVTTSEDRTAQRWDARTGQPLGPPLRHPHPVMIARFSPDGRTIATGSRDGLVRWWRAATGSPLIGTLSAPQSLVVDLAFSPDGTKLAVLSLVANARGQLQLFALARPLAPVPPRSTEALLKAAWTPGGGESWLGRHWVGLSPAAAYVVAPGGRHQARLWDTATGQPHLVAGGPDGPLWNAWHAVAVNGFSPDGRVVATSSREESVSGEVRLWSLATGRLIGAPLAQQNYVSAVVFSPDSRLVATGGYDSLVQLWDTATGRRHGEPLRQPDIVLALAFSPDGQTLAVGHAADHGGARGVVLWDVAQRRPLAPPLQGPSHLVQFSPDGKRLLTTAGIGFQFWDAATGQPLSPLLEATAEINSACFSPDGNAVLLAATDGSVALRQVPDGAHLGAPMRSGSRANLAVFSPEAQARLMVAGYDDGSARLWDRATQKPLGPPVPHGRRIAAALFKPDGRSVVTCRADGSLLAWPVPLPLEDDLETLGRRLQVHTGLALGAGQLVVPLSADQWREQHARLASSPLGSDDRADHDARAREAENEGDAYAARWHLDRLLAAPTQTPPRWQLYARRARVATAHGDFLSAEADYAAALAHGTPEQLVGWYRYRLLECLGAKQAVAARWYAERALARAPDDWRLYAARADAHGQRGQRAARDADLAEAARHGADSSFLVAAGTELAGRGQWQEAAALFAPLRTRDPLPPGAARRYALVLLKVGDAAGYRALCRRLVDGVADVHSPSEANQLAWTCVLGPGGLDDFTEPLRLAEQAVEATRSASARAGMLNTLAAVLYRAGRHPEAIARLNEGIALNQGKGAVHDWLFLAMAHHRLGQHEHARQYLARATPCPPDGPFSFDCVEIELLLREARQLIARDAAPAGR